MNVPIKTLLAGAAVLALALPAAASAGPPLPCGKLITKDTKLTSDVDCSAGGEVGLVIGADGVTLDLNGHSVTGAGAEDGYEGIEVEGYDHVTVKNGTVGGFKDDLYLSNVAKSRFTDLRLESGSGDPSNGVYSNYGSGNRFLDNKVVDAKHGFQLANGSQNLVADNKLVQPARGVFTTNEAFDRINHNRVEGFSITTYGYWSEGDFRSKFTNDVGHGGYEGFYVNTPHGVVIDGARANDNGFAGIHIDGAADSGYSAKVVNSVANHNAEYGIFAAFGISSRGNTAVGNEFYNCLLAACNG